MITKCANILDREFLILGLETERKNVKDFLFIFNEDFSTNVGHTVFESKMELQRRKIIELPSIEDIKFLSEFLRINRREKYELLSREYSFNTWKDLAYTLTSIHVFNRRRAGEIERLSLDDFNGYQMVNQSTQKELFETLSTNGKKAAELYVRITLRGKLIRNISKLVHKEIFCCLKLIIQYRVTAGVHNKNPYVFGLPSKGDQWKHLQACELLRNFSLLCVAKQPHLLRGTELRKHIATHSVIMNLQENEVTDLANF